MKTLENIGTFIIKHWRILLVLLCILTFVIFSGFIAGMAVVGFVWSSYAAWNNRETEKRLARMEKEIMNKIKNNINT